MKLLALAELDKRVYSNINGYQRLTRRNTLQLKLPMNTSLKPTRGRRAISMVSLEIGWGIMKWMIVCWAAELKAVGLGASRRLFLNPSTPQ